MSSQKEVERAFPLCVSHAFQHFDQGMSLRDWFAGQALVGIVGKEKSGNVPPRDAADRAYAYADEMLRMREALREDN